MYTTLNNIKTPWHSVRKDLNYYYLSLNGIHKLAGYYEQNFDIYGSIIDQEISIVKRSIIKIDGDFLETIITDNESDGNGDIFVTAPVELIKKIRKSSYQQRGFYLSSKEEWFKEDNLIAFKEKSRSYKMPDTLRNNINQYLRSGNDDLKVMVSFVNTMERYYQKKKYNNYLKREMKKMKPRNF